MFLNLMLRLCAEDTKEKRIINRLAHLRETEPVNSFGTQHYGDFAGQIGSTIFSATFINESCQENLSFFFEHIFNKICTEVVFKGEMSDSFTNNNYVGNTKVSVSIKNTYANKCTLSEIFLTEILKSFSVF